MWSARCEQGAKLVEVRLSWMQQWAVQGSGLAQGVLPAAKSVAGMTTPGNR